MKSDKSSAKIRILAYVHIYNKKQRWITNFWLQLS